MSPQSIDNVNVKFILNSLLSPAHLTFVYQASDLHLLSFLTDYLIILQCSVKS